MDDGVPTDHLSHTRNDLTNHGLSRRRTVCMKVTVFAFLLFRFRAGVNSSVLVVFLENLVSVVVPLVRDVAFETSASAGLVLACVLFGLSMF